MSQVIIALGSNTRQAVHIQWASQRLACLLHEARFSRTLWTTDIKGTGVMYMNRLVRGTTDLPAEELIAQLKAIERKAGRYPAPLPTPLPSQLPSPREGSGVGLGGGFRCGPVPLDLDILLFDNVRHHLADWSRTYVQQLIADIL